ncbi:endonuclease/exonuclease/phosphatase family protein [Parapedobacter koreensis]|uniref:Exonuclease III n=1 Tax=Parapedobacter koreensis TaxID=332977 RepID=A0A1H7FPA9_9SPHI|nr:endonuclease/exonuclease/phosphatase family protein [Parapedobacter koreensis]SEK27933.1 Exonuclease III [Parapedobacter koreensis]
MKKPLYGTLLLMLGFFIAMNPACNAQQEQKLTVVAYNVLLGFRENPTLLEQCVEWLQSEHPDIVSFEELNGFTQQSLSELARRYGHHYSVILKEDGFPVGITSKYPITDVERVVKDMHHGYIYAKVNGYHVFALHLSPHNSNKRHEEIQRILQRAAALPQREPILVMGDFNAVSHADSQRYDTAERLKKALEMESNHDYVFNLRDGKIDYRVTDALAAAGFSDTYALMNEGFTPSFPTKSFQGKDTYYGGPCRIDFIWVNAALADRCTRAEMVSNRYTHEISDHYPVIASFK